MFFLHYPKPPILLLQIKYLLQAQSVIHGHQQDCFDGGSEITLVWEEFAKQRKLPWRAADYTLQRVGSSPTIYMATSNGRIYTVTLITVTGEKGKVQALGINNIISEEI